MLSFVFVSPATNASGVTDTSAMFALALAEEQTEVLARHAATVAVWRVQDHMFDPQVAIHRAGLACARALCSYTMNS